MNVCSKNTSLRRMRFANYSKMWAAKKRSECSWVWVLASGYRREKAPSFAK